MYCICMGVQNAIGVKEGLQNRMRAQAGKVGGEPTHRTHPRNPPTEPTHARGFSISKLRRPFLFNNASIKISAPAHTRGEH